MVKRLLFILLAFCGGMLIIVLLLSVVFWIKDSRQPAPAQVRDDIELFRKSEIVGLPHENVPGAQGHIAGVEVRINNLGLRGPDTAEDKPAGGLRIAVVGDSIVFGQGVEESETLPALLAELLEKDAGGRKVEWVNSGVLGYNTAQQAVLFKERVLKLDIDLLVLGITEINDPELGPFRFKSERAERYRKSLWWKIAPVRVIMEWKAFEEYLEASKDYVRGLYDPASPNWPIFVASLTQIRDECRARDIPLIVISFPVIEDGDTFAAERKKLKVLLSQLGMAYVDPKPELAKHPWKSLVVGDKDFHPNATAQKIFAGLLFEKIMSMQLLTTTE